MVVNRTATAFSLALPMSFMLAQASMNARADSRPDADAPHAETITADALRGHVSFLASDMLEGRGTPSSGLDIAAEYIAAQFRRAGLEPLGDEGYFQTVTMEVTERSPDDFRARINIAGQDPIFIPGSTAYVMSAPSPLDEQGVALHVVPFDESPAAVLDGAARPCVILTQIPEPSLVPATERNTFRARYQSFAEEAEHVGAIAILAVEPPDMDRPPGRGRGLEAQIPVFRIAGSRYRNLPADLRIRSQTITVDLRYEVPAPRDVTVRNVVGLLPGDDPVLSSEYIIVTAHYDHLGRGRPVDGDDIYNGANDNASGTSAVMQIAEAFGRSDIRPRRGIVFMCFYGEERGLLGARHYVEHPLVPLADTIANVNFEHLGRTDDVEGDRIGQLMPTGFGYTTMLEPFEAAAETSAFELFHHPVNSARFFVASDNAAFANAGIPAHTFCTAFIFPEYHQPGDHWDRIDYDNMAGAVRVLAEGVARLADQDERPVWDQSNRRLGRYREAWQALQQSDEDEPDIEAETVQPRRDAGPQTR